MTELFAFRRKRGIRSYRRRGSSQRHALTEGFPPHPQSSLAPPKRGLPTVLLRTTSGRSRHEAAENQWKRTLFRA